MEFQLSPDLEKLRARYRDFVDGRIIPLEGDPAAYDEHENIAPDRLSDLRRDAKSAGLWAPQLSKTYGGLGLCIKDMAVCYEEMGRSIFGPVVFNCAAPDDGTMIMLEKIASDAQKDRWLQPIADGEMRSAFAMTEPAPGAGSDPSLMQTTATRRGDDWVLNGHKWFITGAGVAGIFVVVARTSDDPRKGLTAFLVEREQAGLEILRKVPIMGPEEHGGHCEVKLTDVVVPDHQRLLEVGDGLKVTQIRLGTARLTHCMRWLGMARRALEICLPYVRERQSFGTALEAHEGVQWMLGEAALEVQVGRLLTFHAADRLDRGDFARKEVSMAKIKVSETLHKAVDTAIQLMGARGYSKDTPLEWMYRYARQARLVDGASEVHKMVLARTLLAQESDFWRWD